MQKKPLRFGMCERLFLCVFIYPCACLRWESECALCDSVICLVDFQLLLRERNRVNTREYDLQIFFVLLSYYFSGDIV